MVSHPVLFNLLLLLLMKPFKSWLEEFGKQAAEVSNASKEVSSAVNGLCLSAYSHVSSCYVNKILL